jgi:hypothetical protein
MAVADMVREIFRGDAVASLTAKIEAERAAGLAALAEIDRLEQHKLDAADFAAAEAILQEIRRQQWIADVAARRLPELEGQLAEAKLVRDRTALARHYKAIVALYPRLKKAVIDAAAIQAEVVATRDAAAAEIGEHVVNMHIPHFTFRGLLLPDLVAQWTAECDRIVMPAPPQPQPMPVAPPVRPAPSRQAPAADRRAVPGPGGMITAADTPPAAAPRARHPDDLAPLAEGEVRVRILRGGYSPADDAPQCDSGQIIRLARQAAQRALAAGAVEIIVSEENGQC